VIMVCMLCCLSHRKVGSSSYVCVCQGTGRYTRTNQHINSTAGLLFSVVTRRTQIDAEATPKQFGLFVLASYVRLQARLG
jgi:hypothetical protein